MASTILLADDSITIQKVVNLTFADEGIDVVAVSNGDVAEKRLSEVNPDLVLADIFMPGKNGYQLCKSIKQDPQFRNVPVVLLVGAFEPFDQAEARRVRADAHLTKPFESRTLVETVRRLLETSGDASKSVSKTSEPTDAQSTVPHQSPAASLDFAAMSAGSLPQTNLRPEVPNDALSPATDYVLDEFEVGLLAGPSPEGVTVLTDAVDPFEPVELSPGNGFAAESQSISDAQKQEAFLDFEQAGFAEAISAPCPISFDASTETSDSHPETDGVGSPRVMETTPLVDLAPISERSFAGAGVAISPEHPAFLAADEPLGDLLSDASSESAAPGVEEASPYEFDLVSERTAHRDWTSPRPEAYSTAQLDSIEVSADVAQYLAANSKPSDAQTEQPTQQPSFSTGGMGTEEARFTPIDIEAVAVEETEPHANRGADHGAGLAIEGLSPAALEEIVRQVVAQISDSVIREVAWEVVPDCVERVIERLARESLSKENVDHN